MWYSPCSYFIHRRLHLQGIWTRGRKTDELHFPEACVCNNPAHTDEFHFFCSISTQRTCTSRLNLRTLSCNQGKWLLWLKNLNHDLLRRSAFSAALTGNCWLWLIIFKNERYVTSDSQPDHFKSCICGWMKHLDWWIEWIQMLTFDINGIYMASKATGIQENVFPYAWKELCKPHFGRVEHMVFHLSLFQLLPITLCQPNDYKFSIRIRFFSFSSGIILPQGFSRAGLPQAVWWRRKRCCRVPVPQTE